VLKNVATKQTSVDHKQDKMVLAFRKQNNTGA